MKTYTIKEVEKLLFTDKVEISTELLETFSRDERKGIQKLLQKYETMKKKELALQAAFKQMQQMEIQLRKNGINLIAGLDEAGRGPLAGPVVCAAVILPAEFQLLGLTDSKKLTKKQREQFYDEIIEQALAVGIGFVFADEIDELNIYEATKKGMEKAVKALSIKPEHLLIDAMKIPISIPQTAIIKGDERSISIAASSVIAKVTRDRYMEKLALQFPEFRFEQHMGYGTKEHFEAIKKYGITKEHRRSFKPVHKARLPSGSDILPDG